MESRPGEEEDGIGVIAVVVIVFIVIIIIIFIMYGFGGTKLVLPVFSYASSGSSSSEIFVADNYTIFTATTPAAGMSLAITPPIEPIGKQFIIDNSTGVGIVTLTGVTTQNVTPGSNKVLAKSVGTFVWKSATVVLRVS